MIEQVIKQQIPTNATDIVIFIHGFGVRWDSRGMFIDIQESLPKKWGSVLFDLYDVSGNDIYITTVDQQVEKIKSILSSVQTTHPNSRIHIVAHSKGCVLTAIAKPNISGKVIFLSPPEHFGTKIENYFRRYPGAETTHDALIIPRRDGSTTHIPLDFFKQAIAIPAEKEILDFSTLHHIELLQTTNDEVLGRTTYPNLQNQNNIAITQIHSDHNFTAKYRSQLLDYIKNNLQIQKMRMKNTGSINNE